MRKAILMTLSFGLAALPMAALARQQSQQPQSPPPQGQPQPAQAQSQPQPQQDALAEAARKAREQRKNLPKAAKVYDNDNLPRNPGDVSLLGEVTKKPEGAALTKEEKAQQKDEAYWRARFAKARAKLKKDQDELEVLQRELGHLQVEYYPDPMKALQQQYTMADINNHRAKIDAKQKDIQQDQQTISDLEDELRRAGGDPGWARE
jgi:DNA repair exonuclease SbcCD ATPase subunit